MSNSFLTLDAVKAETTLSRSEIYRRIKAGTFPRAIVLGPRTKAWDGREVQAWLDHAAATAPREGARQSENANP